MRIRVTTSINVRSNTVPSSPTPVNDAFPHPPENIKVIEKARSKSPIPILAPRSDMATARFLASQRPPKGSHLSAWLHGFSVMGNDQGHTAARNKQTSHTSTHCYSRTPRRRSHERTTGLRPAASTRGVIDPVHSPTTNTWPIHNQAQQAGDTHRPLDTYDAYQARILREMGCPAPNPRNRRAKHTQAEKKANRTCYPHITNPRIRWKAMGCLFFGTILMIVLTIYLALAASNFASGVTFHAVFIFFILVLTIIFVHYLIRLCMLSFKPRIHYKSRPHKSKRRSPTDEEVELAQPTEPIPIILARDDEPNNHDAHVEDALDSEGGSEKDLPPPPPIYGNWRGSVRADPDLIHWQLHTDDLDVQQEARQLIFAGSGHRPPSYTSDEMVEGAVGSPTVAGPLPLFAERRRGGGIDIP